MLPDKTIYDFAIIGLGPAGATAARLLDPKFRVAAIDKKSRAGREGFQKPCGGLLAPDAQKALSKFGLTLPKEILVDPQIFAVKTTDTKQKLLQYYQRFYINMDRHQFDLWLISLIPDSVDLFDGADCTGILKRGDFYEIAFFQNQQERVIRAKNIVGADGSNSVVRKTLLPRRKIGQYVSIVQWFCEQRATPFYSCIFDRDITDSYCWGVSKDGCFILGGAFPKKDCRKRFDALKKKLSAEGFRLEEPIRTQACLVSMPKRLRDFCVGEDTAFLIGEAAGFISPSSLEGISYALNSACALAEVLNFGCRNPLLRYRMKSVPIKIRLMLKLFKSPFMYQPFLRMLVMKLGIKRLRMIP
ncbi:MAG TPA: FAD-binding protein [Oscillospiraceae bacterium]|nr:FAD-binding protein [Oscillospiraceae bacterium]